MKIFIFVSKISHFSRICHRKEFSRKKQKVVQICIKSPKISSVYNSHFAEKIKEDLQSNCGIDITLHNKLSLMRDILSSSIKRGSNTSCLK